MNSAWLSMTWLFFAVMAVAWLAATAVAPALLRHAALPGLDPQARNTRLLLVAHGAGHPHICLAHPPMVELSAGHWLVATFALPWLLRSTGAHVLHRRRARSQLRSLLAFARGSGSLRTLNPPHAVALAADADPPVVVLSSELRLRLHPRQRRIVLAHEVAHLRHGDLFFSRLVDALPVLHVRPVGRKLRAAWRQAIEERADDVVASRFGREAVAQDLIRVARMPAAGAGFALPATGGNAVPRIERLLDAPREVRERAAFAMTYAVALLGVWLVLVSAHHAIETLLGWVG